MNKGFEEEEETCGCSLDYVPVCCDGEDYANQCM